MTYYISRGGQQHGPYAMSDLQNMLAQGQIDPNDLAWGEGLSAWTPVSQVVTPVPAQAPAPSPVQPQAPSPEQLWAPAPAPSPAPSPVQPQTPSPEHLWTPSPAQSPMQPQTPSPEQLWGPAPAQAPQPHVAAQAPMSFGQPGGGPQAGFSMGQPADFRGANVSRRYKDAYHVAGVVVGLGKVLKIIGIIVAILCLLGGIISYTAMPSEVAGPMKMIVLVYAVFGAVFTWLVFWLWGVVISAIGQLLKATLDGAVHTSPFLTDDQRAEAMGV